MRRRPSIPDMNVNLRGQTLRVTGCRELTAATAHALAEAVQAALQPCSTVEIDLSELTIMDCRGLGTLVGLRNTVRDHNGRLCVVDPSLAAERMFEAARAANLFEIIRPSEHRR